MMNTSKAPRLSAAVCNASMILYLVWLLLPAVQTTGRAASGCLCVAIFGAGVLLDREYLKKQWMWLLARAACAAAAPLFLRVFLGRGGDNFAGFYVQQAMFWFPLVFAGYARERGDKRLWKWLKWVLLGTMTLTMLTTIGWLIQGMLRGGRIYAYSRSLGYAGDVNPAYLKELMLRNIGGYDFVYAMVAAMPITCLLIQRHEGRLRTAFMALLIAQTVMIVLSQYTYAMLYACAVWIIELFAIYARRTTQNRIGLTASLAIGAAPIVVLFLIAEPLILLGAQICSDLGLSGFANSFEQLAAALFGTGTPNPDSRLAHYLTALSGFKASPVVGSLFTGEKLLSYHSEALDLLSGAGILGTAVFGLMVWLMGRGLFGGMRRHPQAGHLWLMTAMLFITATLGTVFYSRDIMAVYAIGMLLVLENDVGGEYIPPKPIDDKDLL